MVLLKQLLIFLFMMVLGYGMAKKGIMEEKACSAINWLLVNIANPALVISSSIGNAIEKGSGRIQMPDRIRQYRIYGISDGLCRLRSTGTDLYGAGGLLCDAGNAVRDNGFHDGAGMWRRIYDGVEGSYPDNGIVDLDDAIAICFTENVILLLRIYMVMNELKIIERRMQVCAQQQLIRQKIFIWDVHWIMNSLMENR